MTDWSGGPRPTGAPAKPVTIVGAVFPWKDGQPYMMKTPGSDVFYIPMFQNGRADDLRAFMEKVGCGDFGSLKSVDEEQEFMTSLPGDVALMVDPWVTEQGTTRWLEPQRGQPLS